MEYGITDRSSNDMEQEPCAINHCNPKERYSRPVRGEKRHWMPLRCGRLQVEASETDNM